jgi:3-phenylpropionate/trans-cinnamate dioxygenase ferredoxin reductase subunit
LALAPVDAEGSVIALDCVNSVRDYAQGKLMVLNRTRPDPASLADAQIALKELL